MREDRVPARISEPAWSLLQCAGPPRAGFACTIHALAYIPPVAACGRGDAGYAALKK
jgi:hypothetical protein